jgi:hypothetical protein
VRRFEELWASHPLPIEEDAEATTAAGDVTPAAAKTQEADKSKDRPKPRSKRC